MKPPAGHEETSYTGHGRLAGRLALVTGGDSGIGRDAAIAFAREGAHVVINYLPEEEEDGKEVVALLEKEGIIAKGIAGDLKDEVFCRSLVKQASDAMGGLDSLPTSPASKPTSNPLKTSLPSNSMPPSRPMSTGCFGCAERRWK